MKKLFLFIQVFAIFLVGTVYAANSISLVKNSKGLIPVTVGMVSSYAPFSWKENTKEKFAIVKDNLDNAFAKNNFEADYIVRDSIEDILPDLEMGKIDVLVFSYFEEKLEKKFDYIYPGYLKNPLVLIMLPNNVKNVKNLDDLKKYKGAVRKDEVFTEYVNKKITAYNIQKAENSFMAFDMLFSGKADYILTSKYAAMVEIMRYGLQNRVTLSNQSLYRMPVFVVVSKLSFNRKNIVGVLNKAFAEKSDYNKELIEKLKYFESKYKGAVPPKFSDPEVKNENLATVDKKEVEEIKK